MPSSSPIKPGSNSGDSSYGVGRSLIPRIRAKNAGITLNNNDGNDYSYISIYDGPSINSPLLAHLTFMHNNDLNKYLFTKSFNSRGNSLLVVYHATRAAAAASTAAKTTVDGVSNRGAASNVVYGFNMTFQVKGKNNLIKEFNLKTHLIIS